MKYYISLILALFYLNCLAQTGNSLPAKTIDSLFKVYDRPDGPGCAVLIVENQKVVFKKAYGMANLNYNVPITTASAFDIASVSKQFTGYAIATLIEQGKISTNDDIHKYVSEVPQFGKTITVGNLLHHTSGLRD